MKAAGPIKLQETASPTPSSATCCHWSIRFGTFTFNAAPVGTEVAHIHVQDDYGVNPAGITVLLILGLL